MAFDTQDALLALRKLRGLDLPEDEAMARAHRVLLGLIDDERVTHEFHELTEFYR